MNTLHRFDLKITDEQIITAPGLYRVVSVDDRRPYGPEAWVEVATDQPLSSVKVWLIGTGNPIPDVVMEEGGYYVGHVLTDAGRFVWHVYASSIRHEVATDVDHVQSGVCTDHRPVQHRDGKPPWCPNCGLDSNGLRLVSRFDNARRPGRAGQ